MLLERKILADYYSKLAKTPYEGSRSNLVGKAKDTVVQCAGSGGGDGPCAELNRVNPFPGSTYGTYYDSPTSLRLNTQTCNIEANGRTVDKEIDAPEDPRERATWLSDYEFYEWFQGRCESQNGGKDRYSNADPPSPFSRKLDSSLDSDKTWVAKQYENANRDAVRPLEEYLDQNCKIEQIKMFFNGLKSACRETGESSITVSLTAGSQTEKDAVSGPSVATDGSQEDVTPQNLLIRLADWGRGRISNDNSPFQLGPERRSHDCPVRGSCYSCCTEEKAFNKAYLFGGPDQSIIVGQTDVSLECTNSESCGWSSGDPHVCTHDGLRYDFQAVGEFVLARTEDFEVQARQEGLGMFVSINSAAAVRIDGDRVGFYSERSGVRIKVNGDEVELEPGDEINLAGGAVLRRDGHSLRVSNTNYAVEVLTFQGRALAIYVKLPPDSPAVGLLGDRNKDRSNDLKPFRGNPLMEPVAFNDLYKVFGNSWRVTQDTSLFDYAEGESTLTFTDLELPWRRVSVRNLNPAEREKAEAVCRESGIEDPLSLEDCVLDVAITGDERFSLTSGEHRAGTSRLVMAGDDENVSRATNAEGITIEHLSEGLASFPVEIKLSGPVPAARLAFARIGSAVDSNAGNPYSDAVIKAGAQTVKINAPFNPGEYELRLIPSANPRQILMRTSFRSTTPMVRIISEPTAAARSNFTVRIVGDVSPNGKVNIVPVGSPSTRVGAHAFTKWGIDETVSVYRLPKTPGEYEIRYESSLSGVIYARKSLTIE